MKTILSIFAMCLASVCVFAQNNYWSASTAPANGQLANRSHQPENFKNFALDFDAFRSALNSANVRGSVSTRSTALIMAFPTSDGTMENFRVIEAPVLHPDLEAKYPGIKSYAGQGIEDPTATIRFSVSPQRGLHGMMLSGTRSTNFIDPVTEDHENYQVYARSDLQQADRFECLTEEAGFEAPEFDNSVGQKTDDRRLRKYRLALSCTAEYGNIFAGSGSDAQKKANILAQMNVTMTRVNGVYEKDLAITMEIIPNNDEIIYFGNTNSDPWTNEYNSKTQQVIDNTIGNANYDIGHNFNTTGGGNAGCIGCVCSTGRKGSAYTGRANPTGDPFDIDYVAHEIGHQFGGYHTMNTCSRSGSGATEVEPASGSTIMGYAGICSTNVQNNSDDYFAYVNIRDISANIKSGTSSGCAQVVNLANNPPTASAGADRTIPKSTAFVLRGQGSDPDGDALTYCWEQNDPSRAPGSGTPQSNWTQGPLFRSVKGTASPDRYMPKIEDVVAGDLTPTWEVVPSVGRVMNFSLTVRDNKAGGGQTDDDLVRITVDGNSGPFTVSAPNTSVTWSAGQTQTVTWNVNGTNSAPVNCSSVNIKLSTDGGFTYPITLIANTPNDGSQSITVPNNQSATCRVMVEAADNIFYDISNTNFAIEGAVVCTPNVPGGLASTNVGPTSATLSWTVVQAASYDVRYRATGTTPWTVLPATGTSLNLTGLSPVTEYEAQIRSVCDGNNTSAFSNSVTFTTTDPQANYCASNGQTVSDEYISNVQLGSIDNASGAAGSGYADFTGLSTDLGQGALYTITITPTWTGTTYNEGYAVWIDYNKDGDFTGAGELVWSKAASQDASVSGNFTVPQNATLGTTRMRVSMKYNDIPDPCESFRYGEVEDYTVNIVESDTPTCTDVTLTLVLDNYPEETSWSITDEGGNIVASGGTYGSSPDGSTITVTECLPTGCYDFTINDSYGDGICCQYGNGSYQLNADGAVLVSGGSFNNTETKNFCVGNVAKGNVVNTFTEDREESYLYPNPVADRLNIYLPNSEAIAVKVYSMKGTQVQNVRQLSSTSLDVSGLRSGTYILLIETVDEMIHKRFVKE